MRRITLLMLALFVIFTVSALAAVPTPISYQGQLNDNAGDPVADGAYLIKFSIYDADAGGTELWTSGFQNVTVADGLFDYDLGSAVPLPGDLFEDTTRFLGITVGVDPEMTPRSKLESVPYAYHSLRADTAAVALSGVGVAQAFDEGEVIITGFFREFAVDSINCPSDGYVMVSSSLSFNCNHTNGDDDVAFAFLVDSTLDIGTDQDSRAWAVPSALPSGLYGTVQHMHKVFPVSAGWNMFRTVGFQNAGGGTDNFFGGDVTLTMLFIPNAYGDVDVAAKSNSGLHIRSTELETE